MRAVRRILDDLGRYALRALRAVCVVLAAGVQGAGAANPDDNPTYDRGHRPGPGEVKPKDNPDYPGFPRSENLARLDSEQIESGYEYWIDTESVTLDQEGVVRYTLVMRTPKGVPNIFYEGFRCDARSYRTYAYGTREGRFEPFTSSSWRDIRIERESRARAYLWLLYNRYLCSFDGQRLGMSDIRKALAGEVSPTNEGWRKAWDK